MNVLRGREYKVDMNEVLGSGSFGTVYKGVHLRTGNKVAVKIISFKGIVRESERDRLNEDVKTEVKLLKEVSKLNNPYLIKFYDEIQESNETLIVTEYCDGGTLQDELNKQCSPKGIFSEKKSQKIIYQIVLGLSGLQERNIVHRDIKTENIFINGSFYKIGDLGLGAKCFGKFYTVCGTDMYMAPEFLNDKVEYLTPKVDIWSLGIMLHLIQFGSHPFKNDNEILNKPYEIPADARINQHTRQLQLGCICKPHAKRLDINQLRMHRAFSGFRVDYTSKIHIDLYESYFPDPVIPDSNTKIKKKGKYDDNPKIQAEIKKKEEELRILEEVKKTALIKMKSNGNLDYESSIVIVTPQEKLATKMIYKAHDFFEKLMSYRNISKYYYEVTRWIKDKDPKSIYRSFVFAKKALRNLTILFDLQKDQKQPPEKELSFGHDLRSAELDSFIKSAEWSGLYHAVMKDLKECRNVFDECLSMCRKEYPFPTIQMKSILNDNVNMDFADTLLQCVENGILFYKGKAMTNTNENQPWFNCAIYIALLRYYDKRATQEEMLDLRGLIALPNDLTLQEKRQYLEEILEK